MKLEPMRNQAGVTLIELMITVMILGILAAIAYPSYLNHVAEANRAEMKGILLENAQFLERNYTTANRYDQDSGGTAIALPFTTSPKTGAAKYNIGVTYSTTAPCVQGQCFTLTATRAGSMASDACGDFTLDQAGAQGLANNTMTVAQCW